MELFSDGVGNVAAAVTWLSNGQASITAALVHLQRETCFLSSLSSVAHCFIDDNADNDAIDIAVERSVDEPRMSSSKRDKRQETNEKIVEVIFMIDAKVTAIFYARHPGNI